LKKNGVIDYEEFKAMFAVAMDDSDEKAINAFYAKNREIDGISAINQL
jgi:hypothetical protein